MSTEVDLFLEQVRAHHVGRREEEMAMIIDPRRQGLATYLAVLVAALAIMAVGTTISLMTDNNSGTNSLATERRR